MVLGLPDRLWLLRNLSRVWVSSPHRIPGPDRGSLVEVLLVWEVRLVEVLAVEDFSNGFTPW